MGERVVITGYSLATSIGLDDQVIEKNLFLGQSGILDHANTYSYPDFPIRYVGLIPGIDRVEKSFRDRVGASVEHLISKISRGLEYEHIDACIFGCNSDNFDDFFNSAHFRVNFDKIFETTVLDEEIFLNTLSKHKIKMSERNVYVMSNTCSSGSYAMGFAYRKIKFGEWKRVLVGLVDLVSLERLFRYYKMGAIANQSFSQERVNCPFSHDRSGFSQSSGGFLICIESLVAAQKRGAHVFGEILGYAETVDNYSLFYQDPSAVRISEAMENAIKDARINKEEVSLIKAHGTSTKTNDLVEVRAIEKVFSSFRDQIPATSIKSIIGHSLGASGGVEAVMSLMMMKNNYISPTINYEPDPDLNWDFVPNVGREKELKYILCNSFGLGGYNASLVLGKVNL